jgi:hypothetical protein
MNEPKIPNEPEASLLQTEREKKQAALINGICFFFISVIFGMIIFSDLLDPFIPPETVEIIKSTNEVGLERSEDPWTYLFILGALIFSMALVIYYSYLYINTEDSDGKTPAAKKYEREMKQYQLELKEYEEELKKQSPFYIGDGSTGSEMKNTCKRCDKIWYLDVRELKNLEERVETSTKLIGQMGGIGMATALFNPMLAAQMGTMAGTSTTAFKMLTDELNEKSSCPECNSKNIERTLVDADNYEEEETSEKKSDSLSDQLKKLNDLKKQGILDEEEFKSAKQKLIEKQ